MAATTEESRVIQSHNSQEILNEVHKFVTGAQLADNLSRQELAQSAIFLLKSLPSSRAAVLEHLCSVFDEAVNVYLLQLETGRTSPSPDTSLDEVIDDIYQVLTGFITSNPTAWAPIISSWSIELLGQLGSNYAERSGVPDASRLNELMQHWMTCPATRALIDIAAQCIAAM
ncbi:PREDICTED: integrator complex subunit 5-like [Priapulus caudatus]|uniref:Integrator complex subunit 5-like n=1 Tax=Priapulus caudatus TaxID=37621 RepID=A0ABM1EBJ4_PRICU|nr:PREDICTED: integrator complex subunit 5-like [Priapulus caudatus]